MFTVDFPAEQSFTKTLKQKPMSRSINSRGWVETASTGHIILSALSGTAKLSEKEYSRIRGILDEAGDSPVFSTDPVDNHANAYREYDTYGGWTQGYYFPGYNQASGFFAKVYGLTTATDVEVPLYIRPIAWASDASVWVNGTEYPAVHDPLTQRVTINGQLPNGFNTADFNAGLGPQHPALIADPRQAYPATFTFRQAYKVTKFELEGTGRSSAMIVGCGTQRKVTYELTEVYWNTRACWMKTVHSDALVSLVETVNTTPTTFTLSRSMLGETYTATPGATGFTNLPAGIITFIVGTFVYNNGVMQLNHTGGLYSSSGTAIRYATTNITIPPMPAPNTGGVTVIPQMRAQEAPFPVNIQAGLIQGGVIFISSTDSQPYNTSGVAVNVAYNYNAPSTLVLIARATLTQLQFINNSSPRYQGMLSRIDFVYNTITDTQSGSPLAVLPSPTSTPVTYDLISHALFPAPEYQMLVPSFTTTVGGSLRTYAANVTRPSISSPHQISRRLRFWTNLTVSAPALTRPPSFTGTKFTINYGVTGSTAQSPEYFYAMWFQQGGLAFKPAFNTDIVDWYSTWERYSEIDGTFISNVGPDLSQPMTIGFSLIISNRLQNTNIIPASSGGYGQVSISIDAAGTSLFYGG